MQTTSTQTDRQTTQIPVKEVPAIRRQQFQAASCLQVPTHANADECAPLPTSPFIKRRAELVHVRMSTALILPQSRTRKHKKLFTRTTRYMTQQTVESRRL